MAEDINLFGGRFKQDAVRAGGHFNFLDGLHGLGIKHGDGPAAAESVLRLGVHHRAVAAGAGDGAATVDLMGISIFLMGCMVWASNMEMGRLLLNPCCVLGSTSAPWPPVPGIAPRHS